MNLIAQDPSGRFLVWREYLIISYEILKGGLTIFIALADRTLQRNNILFYLFYLVYFLYIHAHLHSDLFRKRIPTQILSQSTNNLFVLGDGFNHVDWDPNSPRLVSQSPSDSLADPPSGIGGKFVALCPVKLVYSPEEPKIAFLDQIQESQVWTTSDIFLGNRNHQTQIGFGQQILGFNVTRFYSSSQILFFSPTDQRILTDLFEIHLNGIIGRIRTTPRISGSSFFWIQVFYLQKPATF